jgi:hypothetical protein
VEHDLVGIDPGAQCVRELAGRRDVRAQALRGEELEHRDVRERLDAVRDQGMGRRVAVGAGAREQGLVVEDDERGAEAVSQLGRAHAADEELAAVDGCGIRKRVESH